MILSLFRDYKPLTFFGTVGLERRFAERRNVQPLALYIAAEKTPDLVRYGFNTVVCLNDGEYDRNSDNQEVERGNPAGGLSTGAPFLTFLPSCSVATGIATSPQYEPS